MVISQQNSLEIPITNKALAIAEKFASQQPHPRQQEQVRLNTLAVCAVNDYLELMNITTELNNSDSWNPVLRLCEDVADLIVPGMGKLECRPLLPNTENKLVYPLPPEVCSDRIGYIVVEIDKSLKKATLLGFTPRAKDGQLYLDKLQPLIELLKYLEFSNQTQVQLSQWFDNIFPPTWQAIETVFPLEAVSTISSELDERKQHSPEWLENLADRSKQIWRDLFSADNYELESAGALRSLTRVNNLLPECELMRAKLIDLGLQLGSQTVILLLALTQESDRKLRLVVQMYPEIGEDYLPANLKLALLAESGDTLQSVTARTQDRGIQLKPFKVLRDTQFQLQVILDDLSLTETFSF